jgi:hypothetical protein
MKAAESPPEGARHLVKPRSWYQFLLAVLRWLNHLILETSKTVRGSIKAIRDAKIVQ